MMLFGLEWKNDRAPEYMARMKERLSMPEATTAKDYGLFFLHGNVERVNDLWVVELEPNVPRIYWFPPFIMIGMAIFGVTWWLPYTVLGSISIFGMLWWMPRWYALIIRVGYKKLMKERADVRLVGPEESLRRVMGWDR